MRIKTGFAPANMCYDPGTMMIIASMAMGAGQIYSGMEANKAAKAQAAQIEEQAQIAKAESDRAAEQKSTERRRFLAEQRMAYLASGVSLEGTPMIVQGDTWNEFQQEIEAIRRSGAAQYGFAMKEATTARKTGRAQLVSGFLSGAGTMGMGAYKAGAFSKPPATTSTVSSQSLAKGLFA
jgi:flagellar biosynthesis component FlhA